MELNILDELARAIMEDAEARGLAVGIVDRNEGVLLERFYGHRDAEKSLPIDHDTIFGLASITKSFTALAIMQLHQAGLLSVDDPVKDHVAQFSGANSIQPVRISHLLSHSAGFFPQRRLTVPEVAGPLGLEDSLDNELAYRDDFAEKGVEIIAGRLDGQKAFTGLPGEVFSYSNDCYGLLGDIIRTKGRAAYGSYLEEHILRPLGMLRSGISFIRNSQDANAARLYTKRDGQWTVHNDYTDNAFVLPGGGAMKSTLSDMLKYLKMYLHSGSGLISPESIHEMIKPRVEVHPGHFYGYGLEVFQMSGALVVEHGGSLTGVSSQLMFSLDTGIGVIVLCNTEDVPVFPIAECAFALASGLEVPSRPPITESSWSEEELVALAGTYCSPESNSFTLSAKDSSLEMEMDGKLLPLVSTAPWRGIVRKKWSDVHFTAIRDREGRVIGVRYGSRVFPRI